MTKLDTYLPTPAEVHALAASCSRRAPTGRRNRALILLLASTGLRIGEALALKRSDLDLDRGTVRVQSGKTDNAAREVTVLMPEAVDALAVWLDTRKALGVNGHRRVFCTLKGGPIADAYIRELFPRLGRKAGILGRVHAHGLRHFFAATSTRLGAPIEHVRRALGHSDLGTTQRYLARIAPEDTHDALMAAWSRLPQEDAR
jgi:integrase/recombinase XerD